MSSVENSHLFDDGRLNTQNSKQMQIDRGARRDRRHPLAHID